MGIFNVLAFYFFALHADPHYSLLSMTSYMTTSQPTAVIYANGMNGYESDLSVSVSAASVGSVVAHGNLHLTQKAVIQKNIYSVSLYSYNNAWAFSIGGGRFVELGRHIETSGQLSYYSYFDLLEKYTFYSASIRAVMPFSWGRHFYPFLGAEASYNLFVLPKTVSSNPISGLGVKILGGATIVTDIVSFTISGSMNNAMLGINLGMGFSVK